MKIPSKGMLRFDAILQGLLIVPMLIAYMAYFVKTDWFILAIILQFFLGCLQVMSGLIRSIRHKSKIRQKYTTFAVGYVAFLLLGFNIYLPIPDALAAFLVIVIPVGIGLWYWRLTILQLQGKIEESATHLDLNTLEGEALDEDLIVDKIRARQKQRIQG